MSQSRHLADGVLDNGLTSMHGQPGSGVLVKMMDGTKGGVLEAGLPETVGLMMDGTKGNNRPQSRLQ